MRHILIYSSILYFFIVCLTSCEKKATEQNITVGNSTAFDRIPIGTIVPSLLDFKSFISTSGSVTDIKNESQVLWAPCDGRKMSNSTYVRKLGGVVPDLRGIFLRGANFFYDGVDSVSTNQKNPDASLIGELQQDQFKQHKHDYTIKRNDKTGDECMSSLSGCGQGADIGPYETKYSGGNETRPKNISVYYYIKVN